MMFILLIIKETFVLCVKIWSTIEGKVTFHNPENLHFLKYGVIIYTKKSSS